MDGVRQPVLGLSGSYLCDPWLMGSVECPRKTRKTRKTDSEFLTTDGTDEHGCSAITEIPALSP